MSGFNPYRVFKFVATYSESVQPIWIEKFQSLSGFQVRCNIAYATAQTLPQTTFQSLSGFQVRCNLDRITAKKETVLSFNPYRVFKFVATLPLVFGLLCCLAVSIPIGFSSSLQRQYFGRRPMSLDRQFQSLSGFQVRCNCRNQAVPYQALCGFNPYRVFKFVATSTCLLWTDGSKKFQSLSGFQVRCNQATGMIGTMGSMVSIPIGFSSSLQPTICRHIQQERGPCFNPYRVFKFVATVGDIGHEGHLECSFNPYRVFKFVATPANTTGGTPEKAFQSLSGFQVRCNVVYPPNKAESPFVSIPIGFSSSLQRQRCKSQKKPICLFQSLSGFQVRCNLRCLISAGRP